MFYEDILSISYCKYMNIFLLVTCIAKDLIRTTLKEISSIY